MSQFIECEACHNVLSDQAAFCPKCGHQVQRNATTYAPKSQGEWAKTHPVFKVIGSILVIVFFVMIAWSWLDGSSANPSTKTHSASSTTAESDADATSAAPPVSSQSDDAEAMPKWTKLSDGMYAIKPFGDVPYASLVVVISDGERSYYFLNGGSQLCAKQSGIIIKGPVGNYTVNGNVSPYQAMCMGRMEFDAPMTQAGIDILRNAIESGRFLKATTSLGDDVGFDPSGLDAALAASASRTAATNDPDHDRPDANASIGIKVISYTPSDNPEQPYTSSNSYSFACSDKTVVPEIHDLMLHDSNNPQIDVLYKQGDCFPLLSDFKVIARETLQVPAGPQKMVKIEVANNLGAQAAPKTAYAMEDDVRLLNQPVPETP